MQRPFEEIAELSKQHGMDMFQKQESAHLQAMQKMQNLMKDPDAMNKWVESKTREFDVLSKTTK